MTNEKRAYLESEYRCAYCGQGDTANLTIDHISGRKGSHSRAYDNLIVLCHNCHHKKTNKKGVELDEIKNIKTVLMAKTITQYGVNALKLAKRNSEGIVALPFLVLHLVELGYLKKEEMQMEYGDLEVTTRFTLTEEGKRIYGINAVFLLVTN